MQYFLISLHHLSFFFFLIPNLIISVVYSLDSRQAYPRQPDTRSRYPTDPRTNYPNYPQPSYPSYPDTRYSPQHPVQVEVKIESNKLLVNVGDDLELRCHADGPDYRYEWFKDIQPVRNENAEINHNKLYIRNVKPENGGVYTCRARNRYGYGTDEHVVMIQRGEGKNQRISNFFCDFNR